MALHQHTWRDLVRLYQLARRRIALAGLHITSAPALGPVLAEMPFLQPRW